MALERSRLLNTMALVCFGFATFDLIAGVARTTAFLRSFESHDLAGLSNLVAVRLVGALAALGLIVWLGIALAGRAGRDRALWSALAVTAGLGLVNVAAALLTSVSGSAAYYRLYEHMWFVTAMRLVHLGWIALALIAAARAIRRQGFPALAVGALAVCALSFALGLVPREFSTGSVKQAMWLQFAVFTLMPALAMAAAGWLCYVASKELPEHEAGAGAQRGSSPEWGRAASGLRLYRSGLIWRLAITFGGYALLLMAGLGRSAGLARVLIWSLPLASLATGVVMFAGLVRYSKQPAASPGRSGALFAAVATALALLLDFVVLTEVLSALGSDRYQQIRESLESAQSVAPWAMALSFAGVVALLVSFRSLANRLADRELARRAAAMVVWAILIGAAAFCLRLWFAGLRPETAGVGLVFALLIGIVALVVLVAYLGLVRSVEERLRESLEGAEVPTARLVEP